MIKKSRNWIVFVTVLMALALWVLPALAGGWATVGITEMPENLQPGRPFAIEFMVWQHGNKPVHELGWEDDRTYPVTPQLTFTHAESGEQVTVTAEAVRATKGLFSARVTLPVSGDWSWEIDPQPLAGVTDLDTLSVSESSTGLWAQFGRLIGLPFGFNAAGR